MSDGGEKISEIGGVAYLDSEGALCGEPADLHLPLPQRYGRQDDERGCSDGRLCGH